MTLHPGLPFDLANPPPTRSRRRWPILLAAGLAVAVTSAAAGSLITAGALTASDQSTVTVDTSSTVTVTAEPTTPATLPAAEANRATCDAWATAGQSIRAASAAQATVPDGVTVLDPEVQTNPAWKAAVTDSANFYDKAANDLGAGITAGATPVLFQTGRAATAALSALASTFRAFDEASGDAYDLMKVSADSLDVLCERFAA